MNIAEICEYESVAYKLKQTLRSKLRGNEDNRKTNNLRLPKCI